MYGILLYVFFRELNHRKEPEEKGQMNFKHIIEEVYISECTEQLLHTFNVCFDAVEEHKKQISRKIQEIEALEESSSQVELKSPLMDDTQRDKGVDGISEPSSHERDKDISPRSTEKAQVAILQILGSK